jgi:hypothetical protein
MALDSQLKLAAAEAEVAVAQRPQTARSAAAARPIRRGVPVRSELMTLSSAARSEY